MRSIDELRRLIRTHSNDHVEAWARGGRPVVGYFCSYAPPELMLACGALPIRLRGTGSDDSSLGDAWLFGRLCTFVRHAVSLVLDGRYDFLSGVICLNTCDHVRRAADVIAKKSGIAFQGFLSVPRSPREDLLPYYVTELGNLLDGLSGHLGVTVTGSELCAAVRTMNEVRDRLRRLDPFRHADPPRISGEDALTVHVASQVLPPDVFLRLVDGVLDELSSAPALERPRVRLLLIGAELDDPAYVRAIESTGAVVVADELCFGSRSVLDPIDVTALPERSCRAVVEAVARAYLFRQSCARMIGDFPRRWDTIARHVADYRVDGVIFQRLLFCDAWGADQHNVMLRSRGSPPIPTLFLTREYGVVPTGQLRTRVQAFVERLESAAGGMS